MSTFIPILPGASTSFVAAYRDGRVWTRSQFIEDVSYVASSLPAAQHAINLCLDRYWFAVAFTACVARNIITLLPNSNAPAHLAQLCQRHPGVIALGDQAEPLMQGCDWHPIQARHPTHATRQLAADTPIPSSQVAARFFTSGSTGEPKACDKTWGHLHASHQAASQRIHAITGGACPVIGTSSFRHMFGFEGALTLPLWGGGGLTPETPFFPADVDAALRRVDKPALLVTTPFHLRKMLEADLAYPDCAGILSATAPLSASLAAEAEERFQAPLLEIYGSTELGMAASRRTSTEADWTLIDGFQLIETPDGYSLNSPSLAEAQPLHDLIEPFADGRRFKLIDRSSNLINVAGKRSSIGFLNQILHSIPGVRDGVFCLPPESAHHDAGRLTAFVVAPSLKPADIVTALRAHIDPVFLPRPIIMLDALPRDANAKLPAAALQALIKAHLPTQQQA